MEFKDRVAEIVTAGLQKVQAKQKAQREFREAWESEARKEVAQILSKAAGGAIKAGAGTASAERENGSESLYMNSGRRYFETRFTLTFTPDFEACRVRCGVSENLRDSFSTEPLSLDTLTRDVIEEKVAAFLEAAMEWLLDPSSSDSAVVSAVIV